MNKSKFSLSLVLALCLVIIQVGGVFAAPAHSDSGPVNGIVQSITLETDPTTGVVSVIMDIIDQNDAVQTVRVSLETAITLGLVVLNGDGTPGINNVALGKPVQIEASAVIPGEGEDQHPVGSALATFFSDIAGLDYDTIMAAHEEGIGFGVIAQSLWLTSKLDGDAEIFEALITAKQTGDYSAFILEDGSTPENWGQLRKAILDGDKKNGAGVVMAHQNNDHGNGNDTEPDHNGNGNGNNNGNGHGDGNNDNKDKDKDKDKNK